MRNVLEIKDLEYELQELGYSSSNRELELQDVPARYFDKETGTELNAEKVLTPQLQNITPAYEPVEEQDTLCDAALMKEQETIYINQYPYIHIKENKVKTSTKSFVSAEQAQLNKEQYIDKLKAATSWTEFYKIDKVVLPVLTSKTCETKFFFFPKGGMKEYWAVRKQKAAELSASRDNKIKTYLDKLKDTTYEEQIQELARLKADGTIPARDKQNLIQAYNAAIYETYTLEVA